MSAKVTGWVLEHGPDDQSECLVLLVIADAANSDGSNAYPGLERIARYARMTPRAAQRVIKRLIGDRWLVVEAAGGGRGHKASYTVCMNRGPGDDPTPERVTPEPPATVETVTDDHPLTEVKGDPEDDKPRPAGHERVTLETSAPLIGTNYDPKPTPSATPSAPSATPAAGGRARGIVGGWWESRTPRPSTPFIAVVKIVERLLDAGWPESAIALALDDAPVTTAKALEFSLRRQRPHPGPRAEQSAGALAEYRRRRGLVPA